MRRGMRGGMRLEILLLAARQVRKGWERLDPGDRSDAGRLLRKFRGRKTDLTPAEWAQLRQIAGRATGRG